MALAPGGDEVQRFESINFGAVPLTRFCAEKWLEAFRIIIH